jgi:hypothetical protein
MIPAKITKISFILEMPDANYRTVKAYMGETLQDYGYGLRMKTTYSLSKSKFEVNFKLFAPSIMKCGGWIPRQDSLFKLVIEK